MKIDPDKTVAFSGHRSFKISDTQGDLFGSAIGNQECVHNDYTKGSEHMQILVSRVEAKARALYSAGYDTFLCGMAEGFDLAAAQAIIKLRTEFPNIRLIAVVPHPRQAESFEKQVKTLYAATMARADDSIIICPQYSNDCFHRRNDFLVDNSTALICYYNGSKGGTAYTVKRAVKRGSKVINTL